MKARHAARELAFFVLFGSEKQGQPQLSLSIIDNPTTTPVDWHTVLLTTIRTLMSDAETTATEAWNDIQTVLETVQLAEADATVNMESPLSAPMKAVALPNTQEAIALFAKAKSALEAVVDVMRLPELYALAQQPDTAAFAAHLLQGLHQRLESIDSAIAAHSHDWPLERLAKADRCLLRLAVGELMVEAENPFDASQSVAPSVIINEAVELAKQYTDEKNYQFINGILGQVVRQGALTAALK
ncbi:MAG: transcription antitermination factor NusB [Vampirovibrionales bacterium]|nr:transcription antitermination factor NusB [Vampirovibrionales bacterium]